MKKLVKILLLLSSSLLITYGAWAGKNYSSFLSEGYTQALYKAKVKFYDKELSGLMLFKHENNTYNIVMLSEVGLNIIELKSANGKMEVVSHKSFFDNKTAINTLKNDVNLLIKAVNESECKVSTKKGKKTLKKGKIQYTLNENGEIKEIFQRQNVAMSVTATASKQKVPYEIKIKHKGVNLSIELEILRYE